MNRLKVALSHLEARLQSLVEGGLDRLFTSNGLQQDLSQSLLQAMTADIKLQADGQKVAPNLYTIYLDSSRRVKIDPDIHFLDELAKYIENAGNQSGLEFLSPPVVRISEETSATVGLQVKAQFSVEDIIQTSAMLPAGTQDQPAFPQKAYLIIDGTRIFPLDKSVINIGRRSDNHLIIAEARISRVHAQLRAIQGKYYIFDLNSSGGTFLNNQQIKQAILSPGDVISLAGIPLIYGQESNELGETQKIELGNIEDM
ncbi:MAG TPA: FhaA domain-containing protein [Anaerolineales bacterium]|nr:FhaA domain-containing protein [Anaerolineales bacterium]